MYRDDMGDHARHHVPAFLLSKGSSSPQHARLHHTPPGPCSVAGDGGCWASMQHPFPQRHVFLQAIRHLDRHPVNSFKIQKNKGLTNEP